MKSKTLHQVAVDFINSLPIGFQFKAYSFIKPIREARKINNSVNTHDGFNNDYRTLSAMRVAGIVKRIKHGEYEVVKHIKPGFTRTMLEALGNNRREWIREIIVDSHEQALEKRITNNPNYYDRYNPDWLTYDTKTGERKPYIIRTYKVLPADIERFKTYLTSEDVITNPVVKEEKTIADKISQAAAVLQLTGERLKSKSPEAITVKAITPSEMEDNQAIASELIKLLNEQIRLEKKNENYYHVVLSGSPSRAVCDLIQRAYIYSGWENAICKTSSESGDRPGLFGLQLWRFN